MLERIARLFAAKPRDESVSIYHLGETYYIATEYGADGGLACYVVGPVTEVLRPASAAELGAALCRGLDLCRHDYDAPKTREDWGPGSRGRFRGNVSTKVVGQRAVACAPVVRI
jgi:hypothetical protein